MAIRNLQGKSKRNRVIERLKNRAVTIPVHERRRKDIEIIDVALKSLYNDGDRITRSLQSEILSPNKIKISEREAERIWDIMVNTGLVNSVIGFGNSGKLSLTNEGYQLMTQFGSYGTFLEEREKQQNQGSANMVFPQFIIEPQESEDADEANKEDSGEDKAVGKKKSK